MHTRSRGLVRIVGLIKLDISHRDVKFACKRDSAAIHCARHLSDEIVALAETDEKLKKEAAICEERFRKLMQERGIPEREE